MKHLDFAPLPQRDFYGFPMLRFRFEDTQGQLILPRGEKSGKWIFKTEYLGAFPAAELALLEQGFCIAHVDARDRFSTPGTVTLRARFAAALPQTFGLSPVFGASGLSLGGLQALHLAAQPDLRCGALYLDAPVVDLCSCPLDLGATHEKDAEMAAECLCAFGKPPAWFKQQRAALPAFLRQVAARCIPALLLYGTKDQTVPFAENGALLCAMYKAAGAPLRLIEKSGCAHHPHGLSDPAPIVSFFKEHL